MKNRNVTLEELNNLKPCRPAEHFLGATWTGTLLDILKHSEISDIDKIWAVTKLLDEKTARLFSVYCARYAVGKLTYEIDPRVISAINTAERYANGEATEQEIAAAAYAHSAEVADTYSVAHSAARAVAIDASSAAYSAARSAANSAAEAAARSVAAPRFTATYYAARSAAYTTFTLKLIQLIGK